MSEETLNIYVNIVNKRITELVQIYISDRKRLGDGMLFLNFTNKEKMDVFFNPINDNENECANTQFPEELMKYMNNRDIPNSVIFFYIFDDTNNTILEIDLDKHS